MCSNCAVTTSTLDWSGRIRLEDGCDVTNDSSLMPGVTVEANAVLGVFTFAKPGQTFAAGSITQGETLLRPGFDVESGEKAKGSEGRLIPTWKYIRYSVTK